ncbi:MAG: LPXTG cell wall anchor domain-containing protein, partial [Oscillospiraceae bacterium]|nr:LPXTG cell wall anchor domain-containing protein [Oscillospiraceae bacterium]
KRNYYYVLYYGEDVDTVFDMTGVLPLDTLTTAGEQPVSFSRSTEPYDTDRYQLYDTAAAPEGRSAMALEGSWRENTDNLETILTFSNLDSVSGRFRLVTYKEDGSADSVSEGVVNLQYSYNMFDCKKEYLYVLYVADETGVFNQIYMTIKADGQLPLETLQLSNTHISFVREAAANPKYSAEKLMEMAKKDYQQKTGILPANAHTMTNYGGTVTVVLEDANGEALDAYTVDPETGIGERFSNESTVNLPQTGNNSLRTMLMMIGAFMLTACGFFAVRKSGMLRRRNNEQ